MTKSAERKKIPDKMMDVKKIVSLIIFIMLLSLGLWLSLQIKNFYRDVYVEIDSKSSTKSISESESKEVKRVINVLLLGSGGSDHDGGNLTDTMILARINQEKKDIVLLSIPRDLWVEIPTADEKTQVKINNVYLIGRDDEKYPNKPEKYYGEGGGALMLFDVLENTIGVVPDYFVSVDFDGFIDLLEEIGGVDVNVPYSFVDRFYPIKGKEDDLCGKSEEEVEALSATMSGYLLEQEFGCRYETLEFFQGKQKMDPITALKFVRSRHSAVNGTDFGRSQRQQAFIEALRSKMLSFENISKLGLQTKTLINHVQTNVSLDEFGKLMKKYPDIASYRIRNANLNTDNVLVEKRSADGQYILAPEEDWEQVKAYVRQVWLVDEIVLPDDQR